MSRGQEELLEEVKELRRELEELSSLAKRAMITKLIKQLTGQEGRVEVKGPMPCPKAGRCVLCGRSIGWGEGCYLAAMGSNEAYAFHERCVDGMLGISKIDMP